MTCLHALQAHFYYVMRVLDQQKPMRVLAQLMRVSSMINEASNIWRTLGALLLCNESSGSVIKMRVLAHRAPQARAVFGSLIIMRVLAQRARFG